MSENFPRTFDFGPFRLIPDERQLFNGDISVALTPKAFDLLVMLVENRGHLVTKDELMHQIWPDSFVEEANLTVKMSALRRALGESPQEQQFIQTVPRQGYRFVGEVKEPNGNGRVSTPIDIDKEDQTAIVPPVRRRSTLKYLSFTIGFVLVLTGLAFWTDTLGISERLFGSAVPVQIHSIAVLPLHNLSGDESQEYFSDGMTDALISDLTKLSSLRVISRQSMIQYKGSTKSLQEIGRELKVDAFVTGSVMRSNDKFRISVQFKQASTDETLWSESYERNLSDIISLQNEVTRTIVSEIRLKLTPQEQLQFGNAPPVNPEAYDRYLVGKFYQNSQDKEVIKDRSMR